MAGLLEYGSHRYAYRSLIFFRRSLPDANASSDIPGHQTRHRSEQRHMSTSPGALDEQIGELDVLAGFVSRPSTKFVN